jgi:hypothetical protein
MALRLETAAKEANAEAGKSNTAVTAEQRQKIEELAHAYGVAAAAAEQAKERQQEWKQAMEQVGDRIADAFSDAIIEGKSLNEVLNNLLKSLARMALDSFMKKLLGSILSGSGSFLGFASGGYTGSGDPRKVAGVVHGREYVVNAAATAKHRALLDAINSGKTFAPAMPSTGARMAAGAPIINVNNAPTINVQGSAGTPAQNQDLATKIAKSFEESAKSLVTEQIRLQLRPGGMLAR